MSYKNNALTQRKGWVKMWRLGTLNFQKQKTLHGRAPSRKGLWAFPYPVFDMYYAAHKYAEVMPKGLYQKGTPEEQEAWMKGKGRDSLRMTEFWYRGDLYTHLDKNGNYLDTPKIEGGDDFSSVPWERVDSEGFVKRAQKRGLSWTERIENIETGFRYQNEDAELFEIFIAPGMGQFRSFL